MMVLVCVVILLMARVKADGQTDAASAEIITVRSGDAVMLGSDLQVLKEQKKNWDIKWTNSELMISRKINNIRCPNGSWELLRNGSLRFNQVQPMNAGNYSLEVFDGKGQRRLKKDFMLRVEGSSGGDGGGSGGSSNVVVPVLICFFLLLISSLILLFFLRRRATLVTKTTTDPPEENVYVTMHGNQKKDGGKQEKEEEKQEKDEKEEESSDVRCDPLVSMETPDTQRMSMGIEDIYV